MNPSLSHAQRVSEVKALFFSCNSNSDRDTIMNQLPSMSTPVSALPPTGSPTTVPNNSPEQDAMIQSLLNDVDENMNRVTVHSEPVHEGFHAPTPSSASHMPAVQRPPNPAMGVMQPIHYGYPGGQPHPGSAIPMIHPPPPPQSSSMWAGLWDPVSAQRAAIASVVAYILLNPSLWDSLRIQFPVLQKFAAYEVVFRILLLGIVLYGIQHFLKL